MARTRHLRLVKAAEPPAAPDGRRQRAERSRQQIVDAMLALIRAGDMNPSAAQVAKHAKVSLRSVFRHFEDMDSLYRGMSARIEAEILPLAVKPFEARDWRGRLFELVERRADLFERIMPFRVAGAVRRFQSEQLMDDYRRALLMEQSVLKGILPKAIAADEVLVSALDTVMGFQAWRRMRQDQGLPPAKAEQVMRFAVERLVAGL